jgi:hypothetical protein
MRFLSGSGTAQVQLMIMLAPFMVMLWRKNSLVIDQMDSVHVKYRVEDTGH